jgi:hypothetical protein
MGKRDAQEEHPIRESCNESLVSRRTFLQIPGAIGMLAVHSANAWASNNEQARQEEPLSPPGTSPLLLSIENAAVRVAAVACDGRWGLEFAVKRADGSWRIVLASAARATGAPWEPQQRWVSEDPRITWKQDGHIERSEAFFTKAEVLDGHRLVLTGGAAGEVIEEVVSVTGPESVYIQVRGTTEASIDLSQLMSNFYLVPDGKAFGYAQPLDFAWLPVLHWEAQDLTSDHFFRSPAVAAMAQGAYSALLPDLALLKKDRPVPHALDLRVTRTKAEAPRLSYGLCTSEVVPHTFARHTDEQTVRVSGSDLKYGFEVLLGEAKQPGEVSQRITSTLWDTYGHPLWRDIRPQVLPFEEYGRRYAYVHELKRWATPVDLGTSTGYGLNNPGRRGSNFHAWENDLHVGYGVTYYGNKWNDSDLGRIGEGILKLILSAPRKQGAFPTVFNFAKQTWEGSLFWTARAADPLDGYDAAAMGVTAWWQLYWYENLKRDPRIIAPVASYARFLARQQLSSGAIPTYFYSDLRPAPQLKDAGTTALSGAVLAKVAQLSGDKDFREAAVRAGHFVGHTLLPGMKFQDFESFYSCSPTPIYWRDPWTGIWPQNNLSIEWAADQFLALFRLSEDQHWLELGEYVLSNLSLYQQVWTPPYYPAYLYGGFGVMNTDGEWNDGRQARFVSTYADYFLATGKLEYLERAVAAARAGFALMDIPENHANGINRLSVPPGTGLTQEQGAGQGYAPENIYHGGPKSGTGWTGFDWSAGGALSAAAYLEQQFGTVWVDGRCRLALPIDGATANVVSWDDNRIILNIGNALGALPQPFTMSRAILIKFDHLDGPQYNVTINGEVFERQGQESLKTGLVIRL